jgi:membrane dipeptidase
MRRAGGALLALAVGLGVCAPAGRAQPSGDEGLIKKARAIHDKVIALDTHVDISPATFTAERNYTQRLDTQVNLPKMIDGGLDAVFMIVYVGQPAPQSTPDAFEPAGYDRAYKSAIEKFEAVHRLTETIAPDKIGLALSAADVRRIHASGRKVALIGVENGYPLGTDLERVKEFYDRGARYMSLAHNGHSQLSDSNTGETEGWKWNGLSPLGTQVIAEMNRVGLMIDVSHPSKASMMQALAITRAPIIASHSAARALCNHSRNLDDEQLLALKKNGGVVQTVAFAAYVKCTDPPDRAAALDALRKEFGLPPGTPLGGRGGRGRAGTGAAAGALPAAPGGAAAAGAPAAGGARGRGTGALAQLSEERRAELDKRLADVNTKYPPPPRATVKDFVDHIDYIVKKIGIDHVGISSDFDGGGGVDGWNDASESFNVTLELVRRGYTEAQIGKIWSGNLLRVMDQVAKVAAQSRKK